MAEKFIVLPYRKVRGGMAPGEMRQASNAASAEKIAAAMAGRFAVPDDFQADRLRWSHPLRSVDINAV